MDIDALKMTRVSDWKRLRELTQSRRISGSEIDELSELYAAVTADLAAIRSGHADPDLIRMLSRDLAAARAVLTGTRQAVGLSVSRWFRFDLPAALYSIRWWIIAVGIAFFAIAAAHSLYLLLNPENFELIGSPTDLHRIAYKDFVEYYSQDTEGEFATAVWVNNSWVSALAIGSGVTGIVPAYMLYTNAQNLGVMSAIVFSQAGPWHFFRYILPHGMPELTAVFIAIGAGLRTFWALLVPGEYTRGQALARTGRAMVTVAGGMVIVLFFSGLLEGFITPSTLPDWLRLFLGALVTILLWMYILIVGKRAYQAGFDGDMDAQTSGYIRRGN